MRANRTSSNEGRGSASVIPDFLTYPRRFITYKWYRPVITGAVAGVVLLLLNIILVVVTSSATEAGFNGILDMVSGGYDTMDTYTGPGALLSLGNLALIIPALALGNKIVGRRTFRSYGSSRGGWDFGIFFKCLVIGLIFVAIPVACDCIFHDGKVGPAKFTAAGLVICMILGPLQCIGEEYLLRGFMGQTLASWFKSPVIAIILQSVIFASLHSYSILGVLEVLIFGLTCGLITWITKGLEASSAYHICNNMALFICTGFGYGAIKSEVGMRSMLLSVSLGVIFFIAIFIAYRRGMFDNYRSNDAAEYNAEVEAKLAEEAAK